MTGFMNISKAIPFFAETELLFFAHGSYVANVLFMKTGSVVLVVDSELSGDVCQAITRALGIKHVSARMPEMLHWAKNAEYVFEVSKALEMLRLALGMLDAENARA